MLDMARTQQFLDESRELGADPSEKQQKGPKRPAEPDVADGDDSKRKIQY
jgi:hypothetical protein